MRQPRLNGPIVIQRLQKFAAILTVAAIALFGFWGGHFLLPGSDHAESEAEVNLIGETSSPPAIVKLTPEKMGATKLRTMKAAPMPFQAHRSVPGIIVLDPTRKVELRASVHCVVQAVAVQLTDTVSEGDPLLKLSSSEIGLARNQILQDKAAIELIQKEYDWTLDTHTNLESLLRMLDQSPSAEQIKSQFAGKNLGQDRESILSAYAEMNLAQKLLERVDQLETQGVIPGKTMDERRSRYEIASARFNSVREELNFQMKQGLAQAKANLETAQKKLESSSQQLALMRGQNSSETSEIQSSSNDLYLNQALPSEIDRPTTNGAEFALTAPRDGQIVELPAATAARFAPGELMVSVADTRYLWVEAQISQRDWHSLSLDIGQVITVHVPALPTHTFLAKVRNIGTTVSPTTLAIPLVAELDNRENHFRPGMTVWVEIPTAEPRSAFVVPEGAVQRNERSTFVFVKIANDSFEYRDVIVGDESEGNTEIKAGLKTGDQVVIEDSFYLKSELLLSKE